VFKEIVCEGCIKGINMCKKRPCWGSPEDIQKLIAAGYKDRLMLDWWVGVGENIYMLAPAIVGYENSTAPEHPEGRCTFLTVDDKCELHNLGLKPTEGKVACCRDDKSNKHREVAMTWNNPEAQEYVKEHPVDN
jgi:hypothetical protein